MLFKKDEALIAYNIIKFKDNVDFDMEEDNLKEVFKSSRRYHESTWLLKYKGVITDLASGHAQPIEFTIGFYGFFKEKMRFKLWTAEGIRASDYDMFLRSKPYMLSFDVNAGIVLPLSAHESFKFIKS